MLASAPPADAGSSSPMFASFGERRRITRERSRLATSVLPNVSRRPLESAMQNENQRRFAVRTNRRPSTSSAGRRADATSAPSSSIASRASAAVADEGSGRPKATVTG